MWGCGESSRSGGGMSRAEARRPGAGRLWDGMCVLGARYGGSRIQDSYTCKTARPHRRCSLDAVPQAPHAVMSHAHTFHAVPSTHPPPSPHLQPVVPPLLAHRARLDYLERVLLAIQAVRGAEHLAEVPVAQQPPKLEVQAVGRAQQAGRGCQPSGCCSAVTSLPHAVSCLHVASLSGACGCCCEGTERMTQGATGQSHCQAEEQHRPGSDTYCTR